MTQRLALTHSHWLNNEPPAKGGVWNGLPWLTHSLSQFRLHRLMWIYTPGHAGVRGNDGAGRLASTADITSGLKFGKAEVLRGSRNFLIKDRPEHLSSDRLKERGAEKGSGRYSTLLGQDRSCVQPDKHWYCFDGNFRVTAERRVIESMGLSER